MLNPEPRIDTPEEDCRETEWQEATPGGYLFSFHIMFNNYTFVLMRCSMKS